jgi:hypothetical protein
MDDAAAGGHPVDIAGADLLHGPEAVAVNDRPFEQVGHRRQVDVRMRANVHPFAGRELRRPEVIEKQEGTDGPMRAGRQQATHEEPITQVSLPRLDDAYHIGDSTHFSTFSASLSGSVSLLAIRV